MKKILSKINLVFFLAVNFMFTDACVDCNLKKTTFSQIDLTKSDSIINLKLYDTVWISSVGDLMCHSQQFNEAKTSDGYDFTYVYSGIKPFLSSADIAFGNLETVTAGSENRFTGYPAFNTPVEYIEALRYAGFDVLTTSNNHSLDRGFTGVERTIDAIKELDLLHTGTFKTKEDRENILIAESKGIKIAVLAYTYGTNGIKTPAGKEFCVAYIDEDEMKKDIDKAKMLDIDKIAVFIHWGAEYQRTPNSFQKRITDFLFSEGVDMIFGSHPHVIQPMEIRTDQGKTQFIIYSMGNFISNQRKKYTDSGVIVRIQLIKNQKTGETAINEINYIPTYVSTSGGFKILPVQEAIYAIENNLTESPVHRPQDYSRLKQVWEETTSHLTNSELGIYPANRIE